MKRYLAPFASPAGTYTAPALPLNPWKKFLTWCEGQEASNHWLWTGLTIGIQGCLLSPLALWAIYAFQLSDGYLLGAVSAIFAVVIPNLSALSTKVIIPIFAASILFNVAVLLAGIFS